MERRGDVIVFDEMDIFGTTLPPSIDGDPESLQRWREYIEQDRNKIVEEFGQGGLTSERTIELLRDARLLSGSVEVINGIIDSQ